MATPHQQETFQPVPTTEEGLLPGQASVTQPVVGIDYGTSSPTASTLKGWWPLAIRPPPGDKTNHIYMGCLCDTRRAVVAVNATSIVLSLMMLVVFEVDFSFILNHTAEYEAEHSSDMTAEQQQQLEERVADGSLKVIEDIHEAFTTVSVVMHMCGIYGALTFRAWGVYVAAMAYIISFGLHLFRPTWMLVLPVLLGYPHYYFIRELRDGTMAPYNYHNVAFWICSRSAERPLYADGEN